MKTSILTGSYFKHKNQQMAKQPCKERQVTAYLHPAVYQKLEKYKAQTGARDSEIVNDAMRCFLSQSVPVPVVNQERKNSY